MPKFLVFDYEPGEGFEASSAVQAIGQATSPGLGNEYVTINLDDMTVEWFREVRAVWDRGERKVESVDGLK